MVARTKVKQRKEKGSWEHKPEQEQNRVGIISCKLQDPDRMMRGDQQH